MEKYVKDIGTPTLLTAMEVVAHADVVRKRATVTFSILEGGFHVIHL